MLKVFVYEAQYGMIREILNSGVTHGKKQKLF